jgi:hypothetical protein
MGLLVDIDTAVKTHDLARAQLKDMRAQVKRQETALRVIHTWAGVNGALVPEHVRQLTSKALDIKPAAAQQRAGE